MKRGPTPLLMSEAENLVRTALARFIPLDEVPDERAVRQAAEKIAALVVKVKRKKIP